MDVSCCPGRDQLQEYVTGDLDSHVCEVIDHHLSDCPRCRRALEALDEQSVPLARWLRPVTTAFADHDPLLGQLTARAKALAASSGLAESGHPGSCPGTAREFMDHLADCGLLSSEELTTL